MSWILKKAYTFNKYVGEKDIVSNYHEAKKFETKELALEHSKALKYDVECLKITENKNK